MDVDGKRGRVTVAVPTRAVGGTIAQRVFATGFL